MKIIDLLNKIAKGEEVPKKIKVWGYTFLRYEDKFTHIYYYATADEKYELMEQLYGTNELNDEIEIIEEVEDKEYEDIEELGNNFTYNDCTDELTTINWQISVISNKINALIRNQKYILEQLNK